MELTMNEKSFTCFIRLTSGCKLIPDLTVYVKNMKFYNICYALSYVFYYG
jgi:hypothetical protein